jgi:hypothetical protein
VLERRSFVGECDSPQEARAEVAKLEGVERFVAVFEER